MTLGSISNNTSAMRMTQDGQPRSALKNNTSGMSSNLGGNRSFMQNNLLLQDGKERAERNSARKGDAQDRAHRRQDKKAKKNQQDVEDGGGRKGVCDCGEVNGNSQCSIQ